MRVLLQTMAGWTRVKLVLLVSTLSVVVGTDLAVMDFGLARWVQSYLGYWFCAAATVMAVCFLLRLLIASGIRFDKRVDPPGADSGGLSSRTNDSAARSPEGDAFSRARSLARAGGVFLRRLLCRGRVAALAIAVAGSYLGFLHQPFEMRVFNDEPTHALVAKAMARERTVTSPNSGYYESGAFVYTDPEPVYRLYYFSFVVSLLHNLTGEHLCNLYAVNIGATIGVLLLAFPLGRIISGRIWGGYLAQALLIGCPLLGYVASSANYDLLNLFFLCAFILACLRYLSAGGSACLDAAIAIGILFSYCRSESILYLTILVPVFLYRVYLDRRVEMSFYASLSPIFLIVPLAARVLGQRLSDDLSMFYTHIETGFFSVSYFHDNAARFIDWFFAFDRVELNSILLSVISVASLILLPLATVSAGKRCGRKAKSHAKVDVCLYSLIAIAFVHLILLLSHYWDPTEASAIRFFLPILLILSLTVTRVAAWLDPLFWGRLMPVLLILCFLQFWFVALPATVRGEVRNLSVPADFSHRTLEWMHSHDDGRTLYALRSPAYPLLYRYPAISIRDLNGNVDHLQELLDLGQYDRIVILEVQYLNPRTNHWTQPDPPMPLNARIVTRRLDVWRGFLHAETTVEEVVGVVDASGAPVPLRAGRGSSKQFESSKEHFEYIRALHP